MLCTDELHTRILKFTCISTWCLMFMTIDRYIVVRFPLKAKILCTIKRVRITLVATVIIQILVHLPYFWRYANLESKTLLEQCPFRTSKTFETVYTMIRILVFDRLVPWLITLGFTITMTIQLYRDNKARVEQLNVPSNKATIRRVTVMCLSVAWMFFVLTFPHEVGECVRTLSKGRSKFLPLLYEIFAYFGYLNSAVNCYLYTIVSRKFREDLKGSVVLVYNRLLALRTRQVSFQPQISSMAEN